MNHAWSSSSGEVHLSSTFRRAWSDVWVSIAELAAHKNCLRLQLRLRNSTLPVQHASGTRCDSAAQLPHCSIRKSRQKSCHLLSRVQSHAASQRGQPSKEQHIFFAVLPDHASSHHKNQANTFPLLDQRCLSASVYVTRSVCRTPISHSRISPHPTNHLSRHRSEREFRERRGAAALIWYTLGFHHLFIDHLVMCSRGSRSVRDTHIP